MTPTQTQADLMPCPCCGAHLPEFRTFDDNRHRIKCTECPIRGEFFSSTREQAIAAWNRRPQLPASTEPSRIELAPMPEDDGSVCQWYFDCAGHYIDVAKDDNGNYSIFFKDRAAKGEAWLDQADIAPQTAPAEPMPSTASEDELPPLPKPFGSIDLYEKDGSVRSLDGFTDRQMRAYALDYAMKLGRAALAKPSTIASAENSQDQQNNAAKGQE